MGQLPERARGVSISDATASHVIPAYAVGWWPAVRVDGELARA